MFNLANIIGNMYPVIKHTLVNKTTAADIGKLSFRKERTMITGIDNKYGSIKFTNLYQSETYILGQNIGP